MSILRMALGALMPFAFAVGLAQRWGAIDNNVDDEMIKSRYRLSSIRQRIFQLLLLL